MGCLARYGNRVGNRQKGLTLLVSVSPSLNIYEPLTYEYTGDPRHIHVGMRVIIPVANRLVPGWVLSLNPTSTYKGRVKSVVGTVHDDFAPSQAMLSFCRAVADIYFVSPAILLDYSLSPKRKPVKGLAFLSEGKPKLLSSLPVKTILGLVKKEPLRLFYKYKKEESLTFTPQDLQSMPLFSRFSKSTAFERFVLSHQPEEEYREFIAETIAAGKSVLVAVPDNLSAAYLKSRIEGADVYNSSVTPAQREKIWNFHHEGQAGVIIGGLSAVLLPMPNLGAVIVDRACAPMYGKTAFSDFHVHSLARLRAQSFAVPFMEGGAILPVESFVDKEHRDIIDKRAEKQVSTEVKMLKPGERRIPEELLERVFTDYDEHKHVLLLLNRKTSFQYLFCPKCRKIWKCPFCRGDLKVGDHYQITCLSCGYSKQEEKFCPKCDSEFVYIQDISIASLQQQLKKRILDSDILTVTAENLNQPESVAQEAREKRIVIATPIAVNPYFRNAFDTVIYVRPESMFNINHFDAAEMIVSQVAEIKNLVKHGGSLDIYSTFHFHYSLRLLDDEDAFYDHEIKYRQWFRLPPYFTVYHLELRNRDLRALAGEMRALYAEFKDQLNIDNPHLLSRKKIHAFYRGKMEIHAHPYSLKDSGLLQNRNLKITLFAGARPALAE